MGKFFISEKIQNRVKSVFCQFLKFWVGQPLTQNRRNAVLNVLPKYNLYLSEKAGRREAKRGRRLVAV